MLKSDDITVVVIGILLSLVGVFTSGSNLKLTQIRFIYTYIILLALLILEIAWILGTKASELRGKIESLKLEERGLEEKLDIYAPLIDIKKDIKLLKERKIIK